MASLFEGSRPRIMAPRQQSSSAAAVNTGTDDAAAVAALAVSQSAAALEPHLTSEAVREALGSLSRRAVAALASADVPVGCFAEIADLQVSLLAASSENELKTYLVQDLPPVITSVQNFSGGAGLSTTADEDSAMIFATIAMDCFFKPTLRFCIDVVRENGSCEASFAACSCVRQLLSPTALFFSSYEYDAYKAHLLKMSRAQQAFNFDVGATVQSRAPKPGDNVATTAIVTADSWRKEIKIGDQFLVEGSPGTVTNIGDPVDGYPFAEFDGTSWTSMRSKSVQQIDAGHQTHGGQPNPSSAVGQTPVQPQWRSTLLRGSTVVFRTQVMNLFRLSNNGAHVAIRGPVTCENLCSYAHVAHCIVR